MSRRDVPEPWASRMVKAKLVDPRNGRASMRALAAEVGSTTTTVSEMMYGGRNTDGNLLRRVAVSLAVSPAEIARWIGRQASSREPFEAHPDADLLTDAEQKAINDLIRAIAAPRKPQKRPEDSMTVTEAVAQRRGHVSAVPDTTDESLAALETEEPIDRRYGHDENA